MLDGLVKDSKYPIGYHITPLSGLINDPNGLVKYNGVYHVFYQLNPTGTIHKNKHWGHIYSEDLITWHRAPIALAPDAWYDKDGVYSGSAIIIENQLHLYYTGNVIDENGEKHSYQCLAVSKDGFTFEKKGPIFEHPQGFTRHVRDPKIWYDENQACYYLVLGAQRDNLTGTTLIYRSKDASVWESLGDLLTDTSQLSQIGYMWECPDLIFQNQQALFIYSPQGIEACDNCYHNIYQTVYLLGEFKENHFIANGDMREVDWGFEYYAPQSFYDENRVISYGWMGVTQPEYETSMPTVAEGWVHCLTIPRQLSIKDNQLYQQPVEELKALRNQKHEVTISENSTFMLDSSRLEILLNQPQGLANFRLAIDENLTLQYDAKAFALTLSRINWYTNNQEERKTYLNKPLTKVQWFIDGSVSELFLNDGQSVASARFFSSYVHDKKLEVNFDSSVEQKMTIYELNPLTVTD